MHKIQKTSLTIMLVPKNGGRLLFLKIHSPHTLEKRKDKTPKRSRVVPADTNHYWKLLVRALVPGSEY